jgi:hypothetical protein
MDEDQIESIHRQEEYEVGANVASEQAWVKGELEGADVQINMCLDADERATESVTDWRTYRKALRNYVKDGDINGTRPVL